MKILFVTSNRLGDAVLSTGLLDHLIRADPKRSHHRGLRDRWAEGVFARMPNRERTIVLRKRSWGRHWLPLWADVALQRWDLVVDIRGSALSWLVQTRNRAVFHRIDGPKIAQLGAILGLAPPPLPVAWTNDADQRRIAELLPINRPIIVLAPTANWAPKVWPADRFAAASRKLTATLLPDAVAVVLGGPGSAERAMAEPLLEALPDAVDFIGSVSLPEAVALLQRAALFIGNDSGLMHLAASAGAPTIGLFGPTDATTYAPVGRCTVAVVAISMDAISVDQVVGTAQSLLA